jgi:hypothetical protein
MAVTRANAANGWPWEFPVVLVASTLLRVVGVVRAALRDDAPHWRRLGAGPEE